MNAALDRLYDGIPTFRCIDGCGDCCGIVPWSEDEYAKVADRLPAGARVERSGAVLFPVIDDDSLTCPFFDHGCTVYADRPFMCRLFGTAREARLTCPHGRQPTRMLTPEKARAKCNRYQDLTGARYGG